MWITSPKRVTQTENRTDVTFAESVRALALSFPRTYEDAPWGFPVFKVGANTLFAWMTNEDARRVDVTVKLTAEEREIAELLPWVRRASHVGRYGWITVEVTDEETLAAALEWVRESYWLKAPADVREAAFADVPTST
jgi:predicted DNA-binding protein (MmcQ/YjbR family)